MFEKARDEEPMLKEQANPFEDPQLIDMDDVNKEISQNLM